MGNFISLAAKLLGYKLRDPNSVLDIKLQFFIII